MIGRIKRAVRGIVGGRQPMGTNPGGGNPNFLTYQYPVTGSPTIVVNDFEIRRRVTIIQMGTTAVYIGNSSSVTSTNGGYLPGVVGAALTLYVAGPAYGVTASGTSTVSVIEEYGP